MKKPAKDIAFVFFAAFVFTSGVNAGTFDGIWTGRAVSSISMSSGVRCGSADLNILIDDAQIKGSGVTSTRDVLIVSGAVASNGTFRNGSFAIGNTIYATFTGSASGSSASGNWRDNFDCYGTFSLQRRTSYVSGFDELWSGNAISTSGGICGTGDIVIAVQNSSIKGSVETSFGDILFASGTLSNNRSVANGVLTIGSINYGSFKVNIGDTTGSGTWSDIGGCSGTLNVSLIAGGNSAADSDSDGVPDTVDNCPTVGNAGQQDTDGDNQGDACDKCPNDATDSCDDLCFPLKTSDEKIVMICF